MTDILNEIVAHKRIELEDFKRFIPTDTMVRDVTPLIDRHALPFNEKNGWVDMPSMRQALMGSQSGIISEFKRRSPSKDWIKKDGKPEIIPLAYQQNGASAISILTDTHFFGGYDEYIQIARESGVTIPVLYKNFVIDEYQLLQARRCGASAVLLIAACINKTECKDLIAKAHDLQLEVLLEMHSEAELEYAALEPDMCGINNRNLGTFVTKVENSFRLAELLPKDTCKVSESGISNPDTVRQLKQAGFNGFLIGENFMKTKDPGEALKHFIEEVTEK